MGDEAQPRKKDGSLFGQLLQPFFQTQAPAKKQEEEMSKQQDQLSLNHLLQQILQNKDSDGVFIGERHDHPSLRQSLVYLMPMLKANGVSTLSLEMPQEFVDSVRKAKSLEEWKDSADGKKYLAGTPMGFHLEESFNLVRAADKLGIKVIGHEHIELQRKFNAERNKLLEKPAKEVREQLNKEIEAETDQDKRKALIESDEKRFYQKLNDKIANDEALKAALTKVAEEYSPALPNGIKKRNEFAADYIKKNKDPGKVVVWGGMAHSQLIGELSGYKDEGVDKRLNLTAIIVNITDDRGKVGVTKKTTYKGRDNYEVLMPANLTEFLKERKITSWPPSEGVPTIDNPARPNLPPMPKTADRSMAPH